MTDMDKQENIKQKVTKIIMDFGDTTHERSFQTEIFVSIIK